MNNKNTMIMAVSAMKALEQKEVIVKPKFTFRYLGDPALREKAIPVKYPSDIPSGLISFMLQEMKARNGVGLAAQQVGADVAVIVVLLDDKPVVMVNPKIVAQNPNTDKFEEGCLSIPNFWVKKERPVAITVSYQTPELDTPVAQTLSREEGQRVLHEIDHLNGVLLVDDLSRQQKRQAERLTEDYIKKHKK